MSETMSRLIYNKEMRIRKMRKLIYLIAALAGLAAQPAYADHWLSGRVTMVEATYIPWGLAFRLDAGDGQCPAGTWIWYGWNGMDPSAVEAAFALLLSARLSGFYASTWAYDGSCTAHNLYLGS
jgi:hypothetical protein